MATQEYNISSRVRTHEHEDEFNEIERFIAHEAGVDAMCVDKPVVAGGSSSRTPRELFGKAGSP